ATLPSNSRTRAFSSVGESASRSPGGAILPGNQRLTGQESEKHAAATRFAAGTQDRTNPRRIKGYFKANGDYPSPRSSERVAIIWSQAGAAHTGSGVSAYPVQIP